ncbi:MAG TPA: hypothetical protein PLD47_11045 [Aggregatilineales bacterium]|nr:hypothetical protein [Anaerolineales bacterium]HRE48252.1 hypothetical protein [Aggregatilineales bacterium]
MVWVVVGAAVALSVAFWQKIVTWANGILAGWLGDLFGADLKEAFTILLAAGDRFAVIVQRAVALLQTRIVRARIIFQRMVGGREHQKTVIAELQKEDGEIVELRAAEVIAWHELPDDVREKFIRRQSADVEIELKLKA